MTQNTPDNPPAFPQLVVETCNRDGHGDLIEPFTSAQGGMTLRDYFAAAVLNGLLSRESLMAQPDDDGKTVGEVITGRAYDYADAMLAERARRKA
jgi:hypothetical protein